MVNSFEIGGTELQALKVINSLASSDYDIYVASLSEKGPLGKELHWLEPNRYQCFPITSFYDGNYLRQLYRFRHFLKSNKINLIHSHDFYTNIFGMTGGFLSGTKARIASKRATYSKSSIKLFVERQSFKFAGTILTNSKAVRDFLVAHGVPNKKLITIYNGLDLLRFTEASSYHYDKIESLTAKVNPSAKIVTIVANMRSSVKNHHLFLRAARTIAEQYSSVEFVLVGDGELREELICTADDLGIGSKCHFAGNSTAIPEILSISDIGLLCSKSEGFSNAILEYMAAGLPVVATDVGGAREAIIDGKTGFLVRSEDEDAFVSSVLKLLQDDGLAKALGESGRKRAIEHFSNEVQIGAIKGLYNSLLNRA